MTWQYTQMPTLLRMAPWVDLAQFRKTLIEKCDEYAEIMADSLIEDKVGLDQYKKGERCSIPACYNFKRIFRRILRDDYRQYCDEYLFGEASNEIARYFFYSTYWIEK